MRGRSLLLIYQILIYCCQERAGTANRIISNRIREIIGSYLSALQNLIVFERRLNKELTEDERVHSGVFTGVSSEIQNDLIECIHSVIQHQIYKEIENCRFLSIQVDETTDVSAKEQLSVIIRLDSEGETVERIMKLFYISSDRSHFSLVVGL